MISRNNEMQGASQYIAKYIKKPKQSLEISLSPETASKQHSTQPKQQQQLVSRKGSREKREKHALQ